MNSRLQALRPRNAPARVPQTPREMGMSTQVDIVAERPQARFQSPA